MIIRQLKPQQALPKILVQRFKHSNNSCSFYHAHHLLDEIPKPPCVSLHRFMLNLMRQNRQAEALGVFNKHLQSEHSGIDEVAIALASKACLGHPRLGSQIHGFAVTSGFITYASVCNSLMNFYCKSSDFTMAQLIFHHLKNPDTVSYNTILSGFENNLNAVVFARDMHSSGILFDAVTCTTVLSHCAHGQEFDFGSQLHCHVLKSGLKTDIFIGNALVSMYSKCGLITDADKLFDEMPQRDLVSWNTILSGCAQEGGYGSKAVSGFVEMARIGMRLDHVSFKSVISACGHERSLGFGKQVHCLSTKRGYCTHVSVCNVLMSMYSKCENVRDAKLVFENMIDRDVVSWTTMISINEEEAVYLFRNMIRSGICPNDVTFVGLIHAITEQNMTPQGIMVHGFCIKSNFISETHVANSFITMYGRFKLVEDCINIFEEIEYKEIISWNALISSYSLNGLYQEALQEFLSASKELKPNAYTFGSVLHAIASSESISLRQGQRCHGCIRKLGLNTDPVVSGALLDMYAKRGSICESQKVFHESTQKSQFSWTAIISAYSRHGDYETVMEYFNKMKTDGLKPDSITFLSVLTSCGRNGMVDMGIEVFNSMVNEYLIEPCPEHYSCVVDMLGRAGRLKEAEEFLGRIPGGPGISVLQSLLGSCRIYGDVEMGIRVSDALIEMEPNDSGSYVLMSNMFAEKGKWEKVAKMRRMMRDRKVTKEVGFSWADVGNVEGSMCLHGFSSGDKSHPMCEEIYVMAELLGSEMQEERHLNI
ncbi:pentatricopeptide repeat-containing protein at4g32430 mitochondrial [Phtheirospermum japonicum]|uniref:Pentatricopeptide repeat-containing protein at4g32430 mitochondrial n=1 Tax=Phtheirospermum japonicum TaxID=374723 RepID=A0A830BZH2_9LAMI|nr:pentatricopeptide repeat-containing protein at4g32430 mitochondrial [Phtheirospermum japonicum]